MRYMVERNYVQVIGTIWMPARTCAQEIKLSGYDLDNMRDEPDAIITREDIEAWLCTHTGDFQCIDDFSASIGDTEYPWHNTESEWIYNDCMYGDEE